jgi:hypothetical protein
MRGYVDAAGAVRPRTPPPAVPQFPDQLPLNSFNARKATYDYAKTRADAYRVGVAKVRQYLLETVSQSVFDAIDSSTNGVGIASLSLASILDFLEARYSKLTDNDNAIMYHELTSIKCQAIEDLPKSKYQSLVLRSDMPGLADIQKEIQEHFPNSVMTLVPQVTEGQACTALIGLDALEKSVTGDELDELSLITFGACDNGVLFNQAAYQALINNPEVDVIVWGARGHTNAVRKPQMFGWIDADTDGLINTISVKTPLASPATDPIVIGTFTFKNPNDARRAIDTLIARNGRINGEFYLDSCINDAIGLGLRCHLFEVDSFISWGTPNDLKTFEYWQSCFHKWPHHPYRLELDSRVEQTALEGLCQRYAATSLKLPK